MANLLNLVKFSHRVQAHNYVSTSANEKAGQSRRKSLKSGSYGFIPTTRARNMYFSTSSRRYMDFARSFTIIWDIFIPGTYAAQTKSQLNKQAKHTQFNNFAERISYAEHWKLVAESSEFNFTLSRVHRAHFFQLQIRKQTGHFKLKAGKRDDV